MTAPLPSLRFPRLRADWHTDVGREPSDWHRARTLAALRITHGGGEGDVVVRLHRDGTWWSTPAQRDPLVVPWTTPVHSWADGPDGRTRLVPYVPRPLEEARQVCRAMRERLRDEQPHERVLGAGVAVALELEGGSFRDQLARAARVFEQGLDDDRARQWTACLLELRLGLEELSMRADAPILIDALARADQALQPFAAAVLLLGDETYERLTGSFPPDEQAWWGARESAVARVPTGAIRNRLRRTEAASSLVPLRARQRALWQAAAADSDLATRIRALRAYAKGELRSRFEGVLRALDRVPCPWLREDLRSAVDELEVDRPALGWRFEALREAIAPAPGRVPVAFYLPERHTGVLLELRIVSGKDGPFTHAPALLTVARNAIRQAHAAVASSSDTYQPRFELDSHQLELVGPDEILAELGAIDGTSLALPAALAFASSWLGIAPARDVVATGGLSLRPEEAEVTTVGISGLEAKETAVAAWSRPRSVTMLTAPAHARDPSVPGVRRQPVRSLGEALKLAGLELRGRSSWAPLGDQASRVAQLERMFHELRTQDLTRHRRGGSNPWRVLADRIDVMARSLQPVLGTHDSRIRQAQAYAALARAHTGDFAQVASLPDMQDDPGVPLAVTVLGLLSSLVRTIGTERFEAAEHLRNTLEDKLAALHESERRALLGVVRGTQGRSYLHDVHLPWDERVARAVPFLEEAVSHHVRFVPAEAARSRIYLAMALRMAGQLQRADEELERAERELEEHTRGWSGPYYRAT
ncbi:MAG: hypothetical protein ACOC1F_03675, partial [Myxococcota bacterium]